MGEFRMPSLASEMETGLLIEWLVKPGDQVKRGDVVAVVETQKGAIEIEIFESGVVEQLLVSPGEEVPVGTVLARVRGKEEVPVEKAAPAPVRAMPVATSREEHARPGPVAEAPPAIAQVPRRVSPVARRLAEQLGIDLATVTGTGPGGVIQKADVEQAAEVMRAAAAPSVPRAESTEAPMPPAADRHAAMRGAIARAMARSKREIPHYYLGTDIDLKRAQNWLEEENRNRPVTDRLLLATLFVKAVALAVRHVPEMNGFWIDGAFRPSEAVHVGVAISLRQGGLVAPAIHDANLKSLDELMRAMRDLVTRARTGMLRGSEVTDPTITVTSLGDQGVSTVFGIIYPPQVALVGFGTVVQRPWIVEDMLAIRPIVTATVSADHRASDGHRGTLFLTAINRLLQEPEKL